MADLTGRGSIVDVAPGYRLAAPGLIGTATAREPRPPGSADRGPELATSAFDQAMEAAGLRELMNIDLVVNEVSLPPQATQVRTARGEEGLVLETPDLGSDVGQVVLAVDEAGIVTWNFPESTDRTIEPPSVRGVGGAKRFVIRRHTPTLGADEANGNNRGLFGAVGRKVLKVLIYPVTDAVLGPITEHFAGVWEAKNRPYRARLFRPDNFRVPGADPIVSSDWAGLSTGPALLFLHGTFSSSHSGFGGLPTSTIEELNRRYEGRVLAFDHHTLSHTLEQNVAAITQLIPDRVGLNLDIVAHSRGGLVARLLAGELPEIQPPGIEVNRVVFVATPNHGTALADADNMVEFIDRYTSILNLMPPGPLEVVSDILEAIITVVKVLGHALLRGLGGLTAMDPGGEVLNRLNAGPSPAASYYAMAAEFEPTGPLRSMIKDTLADKVIDRVFKDAANDLVVPTVGVSEGSADPAFPITSERLMVFDKTRGVQHTSFFSEPDTSRKLLEWLAP